VVGFRYSSLTDEKMEPTFGGTERDEVIEGNMKETVPNEKKIMQWIAAKPLTDQEQSVDLL
jgi:hypothetical protein